MNSFTTPVFYQTIYSDLVWAQLPYFRPEQSQSQKNIFQILSNWDVYLALSAVNIYVFKNSYLNGNKVEAALSQHHSGQEGEGMI